MSNFFTKEERILLDQYGSTNELKCADFLLNFIKTNPLNYPITSMILQTCKRSSSITKVKDLFDYIIRKFEDSIAYDHSEILRQIISECLVSKTLTFTNLVIGVIYSGLTNTLNLVRKNNQICFIILKGDDCYEVIDESCSRIMFFNMTYYQDIINQINKESIIDMNTFRDGVNKIVPEYYDFKLETINDIFIQRCIIISFLTGLVFHKFRKDSEDKISPQLDRVLSSLDNYCTTGHLIKKGYVDDLFRITNDIERISLNSQVPNFEGSDLPIS